MTPNKHDIEQRSQQFNSSQTANSEPKSDENRQFETQILENHQCGVQIFENCQSELKSPKIINLELASQPGAQILENRPTLAPYSDTLP